MLEVAGTTLSAVQTLLTALQCPELKEILSMVNYKSQFDDLQCTVQTIDSVLRDAAEIKQELLSHQEQRLIDELKDAVFEADDLLDEFVTLAHQKQLLESDGRVSEKFRSFFSLSSNPLSVAYRMSRGVKKIKKKLDAIAYNKQFSFKHDPQPIRNRRSDTCSDELEEIVGREDELEEIVGMLLDPSDELEEIVGKLLDPSDELEETVGKLLDPSDESEETVGKLLDPSDELEETVGKLLDLSDELEETVGKLLDPSDYQRDNVSFLSVVGIGGLGKTALAQLVFNDPKVTSAFSWRKWTCVADQDQKQLDVKEVLCKILDCEGSTMEQVQSQLREKLAGKRYLLVLDDVWTENRLQWCDLVKYLIGGQKGSWIVVTTRSQETATIVGGQMYELQGLSKKNSWRLFERTAFTSVQSSNPPDELVEIGRKIVDGCARVPLAIRVAGSLLYGQDKGKWQSVQEIGLANTRESKIGILPLLKLSFHHLESPLKSCFGYCALFPKDYVMQKEKLKSLWMAQGYIVPLDQGQSIEDACEEYFSILLKRCFFQDIERDDYGEIFSCKMHDLMHDIALDVSGKEIFYATDTIRGNLDKKVRHLSVASMREHGDYSLLGKTHIRSHLHIKIEDIQFPVEAIVGNCRFLRALDLRLSGIKSLPGCIGELLHLRYLDLSFNLYLQVLPKSFTKLCNLQTLKLISCTSLRELPKDLSRLVKLRLLNVWDCEDLTYMPKGMGKLTSLHWLRDFKAGGGGSSSSWKQWFDSLEDLKALNKLKGTLNIHIRWPKKDRNIVKEDDDLREGLYIRNKEHLNGIVVDFIHEEGDDGGKDEELSLMEDLQPHSNLKHLTVGGYNGVKMPGWLTLLPNIVKLHLYNCSELEYLPCLGNLRHLKSIKLHDLKKLEYIAADDPSWANSSTTMPMSGLGSCDKELSFFPSLEDVWLFDLPKLKGWKRGVVGRVQDNNKIQSQQLLLPCLSELQRLCIINCPELTCLPPCTKLQRFTINNLAWPNSLPSEYFHCVNWLELWMGNEEVDLPNWMQFLPALQTLIIKSRALKAIPNWMPKLTSLTTLRLFGCSESLKRRCQEDPPGEDWPYIQHIPDIQFN